MASPGIPRGKFFVPGFPHSPGTKNVRGIPTPIHTDVSFGLKNPKKIFHRPGGESNPGLMGERRESFPLHHGSLPVEHDLYSVLYT